MLQCISSFSDAMSNCNTHSFVGRLLNEEEKSVMLGNFDRIIVNRYNFKYLPDYIIQVIKLFYYDTYSFK